MEDWTSHDVRKRSGLPLIKVIGMSVPLNKNCVLLHVSIATHRTPSNGWFGLWIVDPLLKLE